jgi:hypothetical protein
MTQLFHFLPVLFQSTTITQCGEHILLATSKALLSPEACPKIEHTLLVFEAKAKAAQARMNQAHLRNQRESSSL